MAQSPATGLFTGRPLIPMPVESPLSRAIATHRAEGRPVKGYRSAKGRTVKGWAPVAPPRPDSTRAVPLGDRVPEGTYPVPVTLGDVRNLPAFTAMTAARAVTIVGDAVKAGALRPARATALLDSVRERTHVRAR